MSSFETWAVADKFDACACDNGINMNAVVCGIVVSKVKGSFGELDLKLPESSHSKHPHFIFAATGDK